MAAYLIVEHVITDAAKFEKYRTKVGPLIAKHGGRYLTKGGSHKMPEGGHWQPERVVIIEFPDMDALNAWYTRARVPAAHCPSQTVHERSRYDVYARRHLVRN
jgi:uncharacterized protein (DUF1330 family)